MRFLILGFLFLVTGCGDNDATTTEKPAVPTVTVETPAQKPTTDDTSDQGNQKTITDTITLAGVTLRVAAQGSLIPGSKYLIEMALIEGEQNATVRLWVGDQSKSGSMVHRADSHGDHYHVNAKVPSKVNAQTALWLEVQSVSGKTETGRIALQ
ncbi:hypothetical protein H8D29_00990 [PVC group bacterium]|nr:hypothetical protein [PVC group bacterium]